ncbi:MAG: tRNA nucleotidyltransferase [Bacteroidia bacterium]|nr:MAG: tRNA nucleotidyltransferase [Bacteroidia bacterium]
MIVQEAVQLPIFQDIKTAIEKTRFKVYVVGGFVRDFFLQKLSKDIDIVVEAPEDYQQNPKPLYGIEFANIFAKIIGAEVSIFENFGTALVKKDDLEIEFVGTRKESYRRDSRKPIVENGTLYDDQLRRDFTINAMSISLNPDSYGLLIDPFNGLEDLKNKTIKTPTDPNVTFCDDPLRMMRAIRFATTLEFTIEKKTYEAIRSNANRIKIISKERITEELNKMIMANKPSIGFKMLFYTGLLELIFPELHKMQGVEVIDGKAHKDNFFHTLQVLDNLCPYSDNLWLRWAALLHDIAKPCTKKFSPQHGWTFHGHEDKGAQMVPQIFKKLRLPLNEKMKFVQKMVKLHLRPIALVDEEVTDSAIRRLIVDAGDDLQDLLKLCRADITTRDPNKLERYLKNYDYVEKRVQEVIELDNLRNWQPPITGEMIMEYFQIKPSPLVGEIKNAIRNAILDGEIPNEYNAAFEFMKQIGKKILASYKN